MKLNELSGIESHLMGRIVTIECALSALLTANPHLHEIAAAIRADLQDVSGHGLYEPVKDEMLDGIQAAQKVILRDA